MKIKILALLFVLALFVGACALKAQSVAATPAAGKPKPNCIVDANGNYTSIPKKQYTDTGKTYTDATTMIKHKVYESETGKRFYFRTSATSGKEYRCYLINQ